MLEKRLDLEAQAAKYLKQEVDCQANFIRILAKIIYWKTFRYLCGSPQEYLQIRFGLSKHQAWMRVQVAKLALLRPGTLDLLRMGKASMTNLAMIYGKFTEANSYLLFEKAQELSKRELEGFLSRVDCAGNLTEAEEEVELHIKIPLTLLEKFDKVRALTISKGKSKNPEVLEALVETYLEKHDPMQKAERAMARKRKKEEAVLSAAATSADSRETQGDEDAGTVETCAGEKSPGRSRYAPAEPVHAAYIRDRGQCTWVNELGQRCPSTATLQIDHKVMFCRGGDHSLDNIRLRCAAHNQLDAERELGVEFMERKRRGISRKTLQPPLSGAAEFAGQAAPDLAPSNSAPCEPLHWGAVP